MLKNSGEGCPATGPDFRESENKFFHICVGKLSRNSCFGFPGGRGKGSTASVGAVYKGKCGDRQKVSPRGRGAPFGECWGRIRWRMYLKIVMRGREKCKRLVWAVFYNGITSAIWNPRIGFEEVQGGFWRTLGKMIRNEVE